MQKVPTNLALIVGTSALMLVSGFGAFNWALTVLMGLGSKYHGIYDYYGYTHPVWAGLFMLGSTAGGFAAPGVVVWRLRKQSWQFSLRALLIAMTLVAVLVAVYVFATS